MLQPLDSTLCPGKTASMEKSVTHVLLQAEKEGTFLHRAGSCFLNHKWKGKVKSLRGERQASRVLMTVSQQEAKGTCGTGHKL